MSRYGTKTYSRKPDCRSSMQFDHLMSDKSNKPSTAKVSVAGVHRWGMTSFTSIRKARANGQKDGTASKRTDENASVPRPNKFFKSGSRLLSGATRHGDSDFEALRPDLMVNPVFLTSTTPHIVDLRLPERASRPPARTMPSFGEPESVESENEGENHHHHPDFPRPRVSPIVIKVSDSRLSASSANEYGEEKPSPMTASRSLLPQIEDELETDAYLSVPPSKPKRDPSPPARPQRDPSPLARLQLAPSSPIRPQRDPSPVAPKEYVGPSAAKSEDLSQMGRSRPKKIFSSSLKPKAVYNHRHWHSSKKRVEEDDSKKPFAFADFEEEEEGRDKEHSNNLQKEEEVPSTASGEAKWTKQSYTVIRNVKQAYQCHESGETQEFNDDIEYLLECVQECNAIGTRCLSVLNLAGKCMDPAFRIHLRAHGTMPRIFSALRDAPQDPNLSLCTATLMFVLSQDRLTMDIEASTLQLMLHLLETDPEMQNPEREFDLILRDPALCAMQDKHREKVHQLCDEMQKKGHAKELKLNNINTGILAMETLLSLSSRKAGEWFKEEMRTLHGLDHITDTVASCVEQLIPEEQEIIRNPTDAQLEKIRKIDRCLRVLENVTYMHLENQSYLMDYKDSSLVGTSLRLLKLFKLHLLEQKPVGESPEEQAQGATGNDSPIFLCLLSLLKVLNNLTYEQAFDDSRFATEEGLMDHMLIAILQMPRVVSVGRRFDLLLLALNLMRNLVEHCADNRAKFMGMFTLGSFDTVNDGYEMLASEALVELMFARLEAARLSEEQANELLDTQEERNAVAIEKKDMESVVEDFEDTLVKTLQKAGTNMEHSMIAAYIAILLGCIMMNNPSFVDTVRDHIPDGNFDRMIDLLKKFKHFIDLTGTCGTKGGKSIQKVILFLESS